VVAWETGDSSTLFGRAIWAEPEEAEFGVGWGVYASDYGAVDAKDEVGAGETQVGTTGSFDEGECRGGPRRLSDGWLGGKRGCELRGVEPHGGGALVDDEDEEFVAGALQPDA